MRFSTWNVRSLCRLGTLTTVARELARYRLGLVGARKVRWGKRGTVQADNYRHILYLKENENHQLGTGFFVFRVQENSSGLNL